MKWRKWNFNKWCDDFVLATKGIMLASHERKFWFGFVPTFVFFGMLINLLSGGTAKFELMAATGLLGTLEIIGSAFLSVFGINQVFGDWIFTFLIALLQGVLIGLIVLLWNKKRTNQTKDSENIERAGIITGLIALGAGCPTCGTTLLTPLLGAFFSTGSLAVAGVISGVVTALAIIIAILSLKRLGLETYVTLINEKYLKRKEQNERTARIRKKDS